MRNQATKAHLPILASRDVVAVEEWREATIFETSYQFVGKLGRILARIGDEDLELLSCASVGHGLPGSSKSHTRNRTYVPEFGNCRFDRRDQILRTGSNHSSDLLPKADLRLRFAPQFRVAWDGIAAWQR